MTGQARAAVYRVGLAEQLELWVTVDGTTHRYPIGMLALAGLVESGAAELAAALRRDATAGHEPFSGATGRPEADAAVRG